MSEDQSTVEYRFVPGFPNYRVGSDGSVLGNNKGAGNWRKLTPCLLKDGYFKVSICRDGRSYPKRVHRLVCEAFHGPCPPGMEVRHFPDRCRINNASSNVQWGTPEENLADKRAHGTIMKGSKHKRAKLNEEQVAEIIIQWVSGRATQCELAERYGVNQVTISLIVRRKKWLHVVVNGIAFDDRYKKATTVKM